MILRPYQQRTLDELWNWFATHESGDPIIEASVGAGKSVMIAELCRHALTQWPGTRIAMVVHQKELIEQNLEKLLAVWPGAPAGVHSASMRRKDMGHDIMYCGIGSIHKKAHLMGRVDLLLVDECHLINTKESGMYRSFISDLRRLNPHMRVIGWTGTPYRGDGVWLTDGESPLFTHISTRVTMKELLDAGFLSPLQPAATTTLIDSSGVSISAGDYNVRELAARADKSSVVESAADELCRLASDRKKWLVFCVTVAHAHHVAEALQMRGISTAVLSADTPKSEREQVIALYRRGHFRCLCNVAVLTTGFDVPEIDCIALLRNTKSPVLYVQMAGRGMRLSSSKADCLWLDFTDTTANLGPVDAITGRAKKKSKNSMAPTKICETCGNPNHASARLCVECGAPFDIAESDPHGVQASAAAVLSSQLITTVRHYVNRVTYHRHEKPGKPASLRVEYWDGLRRVAREWVGLESDSQFARSKASHWWWHRTGQVTPPSVDDAMITIEILGGIKEPTAVITNESGKYPEIVSYEWSQNDDFGIGRSDQLLQARAAIPGAGQAGA